MALSGRHRVGESLKIETSLEMKRYDTERKKIRHYSALLDSNSLIRDVFSTAHN